MRHRTWKGRMDKPSSKLQTFIPMCCIQARGTLWWRVYSVPFFHEDEHSMTLISAWSLSKETFFVAYLALADWSTTLWRDFTDWLCMRGYPGLLDQIDQSTTLVSFVRCDDLFIRQHDPHASQGNYNEQVYNFLDLASYLRRGMLDNATHYKSSPSAENRIHMVYSGKEADTQGGCDANKRWTWGGRVHWQKKEENIKQQD